MGNGPSIRSRRHLLSRLLGLVSSYNTAWKLVLIRKGKHIN